MKNQSAKININYDINQCFRKKIILRKILNENGFVGVIKNYEFCKKLKAMVFNFFVFILQLKKTSKNIRAALLLIHGLTFF